MARSFEAVSRSDFPEVISSFPWRRSVTEVHLHHTWRPRQSDYRGLATIQSMWRYHTQTNGWSDIAQHVTIAPDGQIWLCRNFNWAPASAAGFNGNSTAGPFMIEMIGDFDVAKESLTPEQREAVLTVIKSVQERFRLKPAHLRFHNEMSSKTCPGDSFDKAQLIKDIKAHVLPASRGGPTGPFPRQASVAWAAARSMDPDARQSDDVSGAEHPVGPETLDPGARGGDGARVELTERMIAVLADHVINLERGRFSDSGRIGTVPGDVDRIFDELIPDEIKAAKRRGEKARILFYAHGGLVSETNALIGASQQLEFWRDNKVYPLFFIWETGFAETIRQVISDAGSRVARARGPLSWATDNLIEEVVRALQTGRVWDGMKSSAELASTGTGGAAYVAAKTAGLVESHAADVEIHTVGHSAGAIFQAHFMPVLAQADVPVTTAHYLAPAVRNDVFHQKVAPLLGNGIGSLTIFTMRKHLEKADMVTPAYRKSLLYLIYEALEERRQTDILGLEISLRADPAARAIFGLNGQLSTKGDVIWSESRDTATGGGSLSTTHGGFDNDPATMESVARRILKLINGQPIQPFPMGARGRFGADFWTDQMEWPDHLVDMLQAPSPGVAAPSTGVSVSAGGAAASPASVVPGRFSGSRFALCIGIDRYAQSPLSGCVADARLWASTLAQLGYRTELMLDGAATSTAILDRMRTLVANAGPGENIVIQFSGHGTQFEDRDSDEAGGDTPALDECLCAIDLDDTATGGLVIDDELRAIFNAAPDGVEITCFFDCCHSGSATRATLRAAGSRSRTAGTRKARFLPPTPNMEQAYRRRMNVRKASRSRGPERQKDVLFSACRSSELAYEENGQGDFTRNATGVLAAGPAGMANSAFLDRVLQAFGSGLRQNPELHCEPSARQARFLAL